MKNPAFTLFCALVAGAVSAADFTVASVAELEVGLVASGPKWSRDGQWIAFSAPKGDGIGLVRADGTGRRMLSTEPGSGYRFAWSPDGTRIAFRARHGAAREYVIRVLEVATGEIESTSAVLPEVQPPVWQRGPGGMRWVSHAAGGPAEGTWLAAGTKRAEPGPPLLIAKGRGIWLHATGRKLSSDTALNPVWNFAGTHFAYDVSDHIAVATAEEAGRKLCVGQHPAWSPDGAWLVYQITRDHTHEAGDPRQHTPDDAPHLHDDKTNHQIVDSELWLIRPDGTARQQLTATPDVIESDPDWSPGGTSIVCRDERTGRLRVLKLQR